MSGMTRDAARAFHSTTIGGLTDGVTYRYYVRCQDDPGGNTNTSSYGITFAVAPPENILPVAVATITPDFGAAPLTVTANAGGSSDSDGIYLYIWRWGSNIIPDTYTTSATTQQIYNTPGTYLVTLQVIDNLGGSATTNPIPVTVSAEPIVITPPQLYCIAQCDNNADCGASNMSYG